MNRRQWAIAVLITLIILSINDPTIRGVVISYGIEKTLEWAFKTLMS
ncbi:hypothetical protein [Anabaena azotica]|uniref:Transposase n=1 Tax=Anabaena azotica FACHB-119 TaxID=947527 RepID=A0ABR8DDJ3_9NOST|nr:hypothetical protein [Anabaena azotica]MBD2505305.1 hypothetical protein [Anabaena azotica FACHB-119]